MAPSAVKIRYSGVSLVGASPEANLFCRGAWGLYASSVQFGSEPAAIRGHCIGLGDGNGPPGSGISVSDVTLSNLHLYGMTNGNTLSYSFLPTAPRSLQPATAGMKRTRASICGGRPGSQTS